LEAIQEDDDAPAAAPAPLDSIAESDEAIPPSSTPLDSIEEADETVPESSGPLDSIEEADETLPGSSAPLGAIAEDDDEAPAPLGSIEEAAEDGSPGTGAPSDIPEGSDQIKDADSQPTGLESPAPEPSEDVMDWVAFTNIYESSPENAVLGLLEYLDDRLAQKASHRDVGEQTTRSFVDQSLLQVGTRSSGFVNQKLLENHIELENEIREISREVDRVKAEVVQEVTAMKALISECIAISAHLTDPKANLNDEKLFQTVLPKSMRLIKPKRLVVPAAQALALSLTVKPISLTPIKALPASANDSDTESASRFPFFDD
jgi:hypothetical protein